jgi:hypothetical protein
MRDDQNPRPIPEQVPDLPPADAARDDAIAGGALIKGVVPLETQLKAISPLSPDAIMLGEVDG